MGDDELDQFDRDWAEISKMYSTQEEDNMIQLWTGSEILASEIQPGALKMQQDQPLSDADLNALQTDKGQTLLHLGFYKKMKNDQVYLGRSPTAQGIGMDVIMPEDVYGVTAAGVATTFTIWDQPTAGWTAIPAALRQVRAWCHTLNPDAATLAAAAEIITMDANDDHWAVLIFGVMELSASADIYSIHMRSNNQPKGPYVLENQIRVGDVGYARIGPIFLYKETPFAIGLEFRGDLADIPNCVPKPWGVTFFSHRRSLAGSYAGAGRNRCRAA
jgi:hypothetical protein